MIWPLINRLLDQFTPPALKGATIGTPEGEELRRTRLMVGFCLAIGPLVFLMWAVRFYLEGNVTGVTLFALPFASAIIFWGAFYLKRGGSVTTFTWILFTFYCLILPMRMIKTGGLTSAVIVWYATMPVGLGLTSTRKIVPISVLASLVSLIFIANAERFGIQVPPNTFSTTAQVFVAFLGIAICGAAVSVYDAQRRTYEKRILGQSQALAAEKKQVESLASLLSTMLNSVGQGFFIFDREGKILPTYSNACLELFETNPSEKFIWEVMAHGDSQKKSILLWLSLLFKGDHDFESIRALGPREFTNSKGQSVRLDYFKVAGNSEEFDRVVVVATDITAENRARLQAQKDRAQAQMILKMVRNSSNFVRFLQALTNFRDEAVHLVESGTPSADLKSNLIRIMHTIKGTASTLSVMELANFAHEVESTVKQLIPDNLESWRTTQNLIRVQLEKLQEMHSQLTQDLASVVGSRATTGRQFRRISEDDLRQFHTLMCESNIDSGLQNVFANNFIKEPIADYVLVFSDMAQDLANQLYKKLKPIRVENGDLRIDPEPYFPLFDSFVHIVRNSVDHGLELPGRRQDLGKDEAGEIVFRFNSNFLGREPWLHIEIADDGAGIDPERVRAAAKKHGLPKDKWENASAEQLIHLVFSPEFSTRTEVTSISGRGVGLSAVEHEVKALGGQIHIETAANKGTTFVIDLPVKTSLRTRLAA